MVVVAAVDVTAEVDSVEAEAVAVVEVSTFVPFDPLFHLLMELTRPMVGGFTSSNSAPLGGNRRW
jgi:hypothetical protein